MVDKKALEKVYKQNLENDIINAISEMKGIELRKAFDIYYSSKLAEQISNDSYGIENMDAKYLAEDLIENEPVLTMVRLRKYNKKYTKCIYFSFERDIIPLRRV